MPAEREAIVKWLLEMVDSIAPATDWCIAQRVAFKIAAAAIERGEHLKGKHT